MSEQRSARWVWWCAPPLLVVVMLLFVLMDMGVFSGPALVWPASPVPGRQANVRVAGPIPPSITGQDSLVELVRSSLVYVDVEGSNADHGPTAGATGLVWDLNGHVVVPAQLVKSAQYVRVMLPDGTGETGTVVGADTATNVALVRLNRVHPGAAPLLRAGREDIKAHRPVRVVWNKPDGTVVSQTGEIVETGRLLPVGAMQTALGVSYFAIPDVLKVEVAEPVTGTQSAVVVDEEGRFEGFVLPVFHSQTSVYAVPGYLMARVIEGLIHEGQYRYPWVGLSGQTVTPELAEALGLPVTSGVLVLAVLPGGPAEKAGLRGGTVLVRIGDRLTYTGGDIITGIDNEPIATVDDLIRYLIYQTHVGQTVRMRVMRDGHPVWVNLQVGARPEVPIFD